jgi:hypothetical protein
MIDSPSPSVTAAHPALILFYGWWGILCTLIGLFFAYTAIFVPSRHAAIFDIALAIFFLPTGAAAVIAAVAVKRMWRGAGVWQTLAFLVPLCVVLCVGVLLVL